MASQWNLQSSSQKEFLQHSAPGVALLAPAQDCFWHIGFIFHILPYLCWRAWGHKNAGSRWSQELSALSSFTELPVTWEWRCSHHHISDHPPGRKLPPSVLSQACSCDVYHGSHSEKGHRNKAATSKAEFCPPMRAAWLASLSAFQFPWTLVVSPFGVLGNA
jgi:hypothetical protein